jgi:hypothetical protein
MTDDLPSYRVYFHEDRDGTFVIEEDFTGCRYFDMRPRDTELFFCAVQEQCNLGGVPTTQSSSFSPSPADSCHD